MSVRWDIAPRARVAIWSFTGLNFSGTRSMTQISARGLVSGDPIDGRRLKSVGIIGYPGVQVTFITSLNPVEWEDYPWRTVRLMEGYTFEMKDGKPAVQVPDLDVMDNFDATRSPIDNPAPFPQHQRLAQGTTWTFGRSTNLPLKCNIRVIRVERFE